MASGAEGIVLDRTIFYARGGGQPGDGGALHWNGGEMAVAETIKGEGAAIPHLPAPGADLPPVGAVVTGTIDRDRRHRLMRMHTRHASAVQPDQGRGGDRRLGRRGSVSVGLRPAEPPPKEQIEAGLNALIEADHPVHLEWVGQLGAGALTHTRCGPCRCSCCAAPAACAWCGSARKTPLVDLQPCGATHVARTGEIGFIAVVKIENKGKQNRRTIIAPVAAGYKPTPPPLEGYGSHTSAE